MRQMKNFSSLFVSAIFYYLSHWVQLHVNKLMQLPFNYVLPIKIVLVVYLFYPKKLSLYCECFQKIPKILSILFQSNFYHLVRHLLWTKIVYPRFGVTKSTHEEDYKCCHNDHNRNNHHRSFQILVCIVWMYVLDQLLIVPFRLTCLIPGLSIATTVWIPFPVVVDCTVWVFYFCEFFLINN